MLPFRVGDVCWATLPQFGKWPAKVIEQVGDGKYRVHPFPLDSETPYVTLWYLIGVGMFDHAGGFLAPPYTNFSP
jgi:hypothetical protein